MECSVNLGSGVGDYGGMGGLPFHQVPYFVRNSRIFYYCDADYYYFSNNIQDHPTADNKGLYDFFKLRNNGEKYTIFAREDNYFVSAPGYGQVDGTRLSANYMTLKNVYGTFLPGQIIKVNHILTDLIVDTWTPGTLVIVLKSETNWYDGQWIEAYDNASSIYAPSWPTNVSDPVYLEYTERLDIEIPIGRNSPLNVANDITRQLRQTGDFNKIYYNRDLNSPNFTPQRAISGYIESKTYKIFNAMNAIDMNNTNYDEFNASETTGSTPLSQPNASALSYMNALQFIGVKRPDLYLLGRDFDSTLDLMGGNGEMIIESTIATTDNGGLGPNYIPTNIIWSEDNLLKLKALFDLQGNYPELFKAPYNDYGNGAEHQSGSGVRGKISVNTNRFLHINPYRNDTTGAERNILGTDDISSVGAIFDDVLSNFISLPLYFYWDEARAEITSGGEDASNLAYGFAYKQRVDTGHGAPYDAISFYTGNIGGYQPPLEYFERNGSAGSHDAPSPGGTTILAETRIGWDQHWTAFSTCIIALCDGYIDYPYNQAAIFSADNIQPDYEDLWQTGINSVWDTPAGITASPASYVEQIKKVYLGANEPLLNFDANSGRFDFSQLHTPEYIGNDIRAGSTPSDPDAVTVPIDPNADNKVYKINKRITNTNWTTAMIPYSCNFVQSASDTSATKYDLALMNVNFDQFSIFDSKSGIAIKEFGYPEALWATGLWGILGFTYNQFNAILTENNTYNTRITEENMKSLAFATTNADITSGQSIEYITNEWGVPMYNQQVPGSFCWYGKNFNTSALQVSKGTRDSFLIQNFPPITEIQTSITLVAQNLPRKMLKPYFCIRSDLIDMAHYIGGEDSGQILPVCAIINKINGYGDYYFSNENPLIFTATQRRTITSITTSIHYPDQKFAVVDRDSAIIYRLERNQLAHSNILEEILSKTNKKNIKN